MLRRLVTAAGRREGSGRVWAEEASRAHRRHHPLQHLAGSCRRSSKEFHAAPIPAAEGGIGVGSEVRQTLSDRIPTPHPSQGGAGLQVDIGARANLIEKLLAAFVCLFTNVGVVHRNAD